MNRNRMIDSNPMMNTNLLVTASLLAMANLLAVSKQIINTNLQAKAGSRAASPDLSASTRTITNHEGI